MAQKDPRAKFVDEPGSATGSGSTVFSSNGSGQLRRTLPSLSPANDISCLMTQVIVAHIL